VDARLAVDEVDERETGAPVAVAPVALPEDAGRRRRSFLYRPEGMWLVRVVTAIVLLGSWQLYAQGKVAALTAPPTDVARALWEQTFVTGSIWGPLGSSMTGLGLGFALAVALGIPLGIVMGRWRGVEHVLDPYVMFLYALPHVAFVPLMIVWFGFELKFRLAYILFSAIWPVLINTMAGVKSIDPELLAVGTSLCAKERQMLRTIVLPAAAPFMVAGARQAFSSAWVGVVVAEILSTQTGLGGEITRFGNFFLTAQMIVPVIYIMIIAVIIQAVAAWLQARLTPWHETTGN
jgi:ABC-type nitrate/sulfonate/bicarbonate transport system permease component